MKSSIPTLTLDGFVTNKSLQVVKLWEYFLTADYSQSNTFYGEIASMKYILATATIGEMKSELTTAISKLYNAYFDYTTVDVDVIESDSSSEVVFKIYVTLTDDDKTYMLNKEVHASNGDILNLEDLLDQVYLQHS